MSQSAGQVSAKASGSEKRRRTHNVPTRFEEDEYSVLLEKAQTAGLSRGAYIRALVIGSPGPRAQRTPPVNAEVLARATAALNKVGSNLNQIAHVLNASGATSTAHEFLSTLALVREAATQMLELGGRKKRR